MPRVTRLPLAGRAIIFRCGRRAIITNNSSAVARAFKCFCSVTIHRDMGPPVELRRHRANVSGECKLMRALRGENAVTPIVSLSAHPRALLIAAAASFTFNEHPPPRDVCFSIKPTGKCARSLIHRGSFSRGRERERKGGKGRWGRVKRAVLNL